MRGEAGAAFKAIIEPLQQESRDVVAQADNYLVEQTATVAAAQLLLEAATASQAAWKMEVDSMQVDLGLAALCTAEERRDNIYDATCFGGFSGDREAAEAAAMAAAMEKARLKAEEDAAEQQ